jgi:hypothetical protein
MLEEEKERGKRIAGCSPRDRNALLARLIFGEDWGRARDAMALLMESWGIAQTLADTKGFGEGRDGE